MKIKGIKAREIFDARGMPTILCQVMLSSGEVVSASVPSGTSRGSGEAQEKRDPDRLMGMGVASAVEMINTKLAPLIIGLEPDVIAIDTMLLEKDGTEKKTVLGANTMLAISTAVCKAQALADGMELYECIAYLCDIQEVTLPCPMFNIIGGGMHTRSGFPIQEVMVMPIGANSFKEAFEMGVLMFHQVLCLLEKEGLSTLVADEGCFAPQMLDINMIFELLLHAMANLGIQKQMLFSLDMAASFWYNSNTHLYSLYNSQYTHDELIAWYVQLTKKYPIYSIEDGISEYDWQGWELLSETFNDSMQIVGDDIFVTNVNRIVKGIEHNIGNAVLIKPNQVGTVTETLQAIKLCHEYDKDVIISHRSGETNDTFIADLSVGCNATQIKAGGCFRGERIAKYNRLVEIEEHLRLSVRAS